jgi:hypothetical protein
MTPNPKIVPERDVRRRDPNTNNPELAIIYGRRKDDKPKKRKAQFFVTFCHWSTVALLVIAVLTGMRLGWAFVDSPLGGDSGRWGHFLNAVAPEGAMLTWHIYSSWLLALISIVYVIYLLRTKESRRLRIRGSDFATVAKAIAKPKMWRNKFVLWSANLIVYWLAFLMLFVAFVTGIVIYQLDWNLSDWLGGYSLNRLLHGVVAYAFVPYVIVHILLQWAFSTFLSIFKATFYAKRIKAGVLGVVFACATVGALYYLNGRSRTLVAVKITAVEAPILDGDPSDPAWARTEGVTVATVKGLNFPDGRTRIQIKALHDGERVYVQLQWNDPSRSGMRYPLQKTEQGWKVLGSGFEKNDEQSYYEDKIAMYITDVPDRGCEASCHLGKDPTDLGKDVATWGLHYTDGEIADIWHWKYVRTNEMNGPGKPGFADDMYFGPPQPVKDPKKRYTAGYFDDPQPAGGYKYNFDKLDPAKKVHEGFVKPKVLPKSAPASDGTNQAATHDGLWWIRDGEGVPYSPEADTLPVGALIPNIVVAPFQGDRANVLAKGAWRDGKWTVEFSRVYDTGSKYDVAITPERAVYLTVAAYQRVQTRHSEQLEPVRLVLQK